MSKKRTVMECLASKEIQEKIAMIVNLLSNGESTIGSYIDNVLLEHLNEHKDEINALYQKEIKKQIDSLWKSC